MKYSLRALSLLLFVLSFASCDTSLTEKVVYRDRTAIYGGTPAPEREEKQLLALSMQGGGMRGYMQMYFLRLLEKELLERGDVGIPEKFDLFAGASIGGIHALMFAVKGSSAEEAFKFYEPSNFKRIFKEEERGKSFLGEVSGWLMGGDPMKMAYDKFFRDSYGLPPYEVLPSLDKAKFADTEKDKVLSEEKKFGNRRLSDVREGKDVIVPAFRIVDKPGSAFYFSTIDYKKDPQFNTIQSVRVADIADATSAVPFYFPVKKIVIGGEEHYFLDGALVENNLSSTIIDIYLKKGYQGDEIRILNLGAGEPEKLPGKEEIDSNRKGGAYYLLSELKIDQRALGGSSEQVLDNAAWRIGSNFVNVPFSGVNVELESMTDFTPESLKKMEKAAEDAWEKHKDEILRLLSD